MIGRVRALFALVVLSLCAAVRGVDFDGCGGSLRLASELEPLLDGAPVDFSFLSVELYALMSDANGGSRPVLKETVECAPNGYWFAPLYDFGNYELRVKSPAGWHIEPETVQFRADANTAPREDYEFKLTGVSIDGVVRGGEGEPSQDETEASDLLVSLYDASNESGEPLASVRSLPDGTFHFDNVAARDVVLRATHDEWLVTEESREQRFSLTWKGLHQVPRTVRVAGYSVVGHVESAEGESVRLVPMLLYATGATQSASALDCGGDWDEAKSVVASLDPMPLCAVRSDESGKFTFRGVPPGEYSLVPHYAATGGASFVVSPRELRVTVRRGASLYLHGATFRVVGFAVSGRVVHGTSEGRGAAGVTVKLAGASGSLVESVTDENGEYVAHLGSVGTYTLTGALERSNIDQMTGVRLTPNTPVVPTLVVSGYDVCGEVVGVSGARELNLRRQGTSVKSIKSNANGSFCFANVAPGEYVVAPTVSDSDRKSGLLLSPAELDVVVVDAPVDGVVFAPSRVTVSGIVHCLASPCDSSLALTLTQTEGPRTSIEASVTIAPRGKTAHVQFDNVTPGQWEAQVTSPTTWCWTTESVAVTVGTDDVSDLTVAQQTGFKVPLSANHDVDVEMWRESTLVETFSFDSSSTNNRLCLPDPGSYELRPRSCVKFERGAYRFDTSQPSEVHMIASAARVSGQLSLADSISGGTDQPIEVVVEWTDQSEPLVVKTVPIDGRPGVHTFEAAVPFGVSASFSPRLGDVVFYPSSLQTTIPSASVVGASGCVSPLGDISARPSVWVEGSVRPQMSGVQVSAFVGETRVADVLTDEEGNYRVGPLRDDETYTFAAHLDGYSFAESQSERGVFEAVKLGRVRVTVVDTEGVKLSGVRLSLSANNFRKNSATEDDGQMLFDALVPGNYHLRALLKEYAFAPSSKNIDVTGENEVAVEFVGTRTSFSVMGRVATLAGDGESGANVEACRAVPDAACELAEQAETDRNGDYRLRGLVPGEDYEIRVLSKGRVERATPSSVSLKMEASDASDVDFVVFRASPHFDLTGSVSVDDDQHLSTFTVELLESSQSTEPLAVYPLRAARYFEFPRLNDDKKYYVRITTSLDPRVFDIDGAAPQPVEYVPSLDHEGLRRVNLAVGLNIRVRDAMSSVVVDERASDGVGIPNSGSGASVLFGLIVVALFWYNAAVIEFYQDVQTNGVLQALGRVARAIAQGTTSSGDKRSRSKDSSRRSNNSSGNSQGGSGKGSSAGGADGSQPNDDESFLPARFRKGKKRKGGRK